MFGLGVYKHFQRSVSLARVKNLAHHNINIRRISTHRLSSIAKDRGWFTEYTPYETQVGDFYGMMAQPIRVIGIGTVELLTEPPPNSVGRDDLPRPLRLTTVLHAPSAACNIIGMPILIDYDVVSTFCRKGDTRGYIAENGGRQIAYFDPSRTLLHVKLRDPPKGTYPLKSGGPWLINAKWADTEIAKWDAAQQPKKNSRGPLNNEEKIWLKERFGDEFHFLRNYGHNIYKEEDREEGRALLRALIWADQD